MAYPTHGDRIAEALFDVLDAAPEKQIEALFEAVNTFRTEAPRSYDQVRRHPFARRLLDAINETQDLYKETKT